MYLSVRFVRVDKLHPLSPAEQHGLGVAYPRHVEGAASQEGHHCCAPCFLVLGIEEELQGVSTAVEKVVARFLEYFHCTLYVARVCRVVYCLVLSPTCLLTLGAHAQRGLL